jgi:Nucleoside 2-deoxyribosyltransferase
MARKRRPTEIGSLASPRPAFRSTTSVRLRYSGMCDWVGLKLTSISRLEPGRPGATSTLCLLLQWAVLPAVCPTDSTPQDIAINRAMEWATQRCDAMMVYLTPFRGPSADVGSAYEMGFMRPIGPSISAYPNDPLPSAGRTASAPNGGVRRFRRCGVRAHRTAQQPPCSSAPAQTSACSAPGCPLPVKSSVLRRGSSRARTHPSPGETLEHCASRNVFGLDQQRLLRPLVAWRPCS